jgi:hypothetical protein
MSSFSTQVLETGIRNMMEFSRELLGTDWGCLHRPDMERLQEELRNKLSFIEYHAGYLIASYKLFAEEDEKQNRDFHSLQLDLEDVKNQHQAALTQIDDLEAELNRRLADNEARYKELLDAARASVLRSGELERENELLNAELAKLARPEEPEEAAHEWKSPQGIWFCLDKDNTYGAGCGALWYLDEDKDEWMLSTGWSNDDSVNKLEQQVENLEKKLTYANECVYTREQLLLEANEYN